MVVGESSINNIMGGIENTGIRLHNHKRKLKQRFDIIKKLGQGTYGKVQLGINKETGQEVAIKTIKKSKIESEADLIRIRREIQIMSSVQHPNIIHIYEVFENKEKMILVMEYAAGGELYDYLSERKVLAEDEARRIFRQIATACYYCHKHKICHRDLKLENILLDENSNAKIADFGLSNVFDDQRLLSTFCGSPLYASPEIVRGTPYHGPEVDCWSLGVLLYTLVYGAMPFDGSNFKRLVKQISQGDYFEPQKPSPASPLIKDMLTVNPKKRADIEKICMHWWVNETYDDSCLDISEELANQTPVRLDVLLSLAPPPPQLESDKLVVTGEQADETIKAEALAPTRSQSAGSLMELSHPAERRIKELFNDEKTSAKRKLETTVSTDRANFIGEGSKRKDKIIKENTIADITVHGTIHENASMEDASMSEAVALEKSLTQTISREMDVEAVVPELSSQGAACEEILREEMAKKPPEGVGVEKLPAEEKENVEAAPKKKETVETKSDVVTTKVPTKKKVVKKKVLAEKNADAKPAPSKPTERNGAGAEPDKPQEPPVDVKTEEPTPPQAVGRRRSKIFETAEKFQNLISASDSKGTVPEKPKKLIIPGVSVDGFKKEFERKASLTSPTNGKGLLSKKSTSVEKAEEETAAEIPVEKEVPKVEEAQSPPTPQPEQTEDRRESLKKAVSIISSALEDGARKSKSRPCVYRKPPVPFGSGGRSASGSIGLIPTPLSPTEDKRFLKLQVGPNDIRSATVEVSTPEHTRYITEPFKQDENKTSSAEITLKSATLPRRKTTKAEIRLDYPVPKPATMEFKTEMAHHVAAPPKVTTQRSEVTFPVTSPPVVNFRATSVDAKSSPKERIIPIAFEKDANDKTEKVQSPPAKPPMPKPFQTQKSNVSQRSGSLSRQSTQESDSDTTPTTGEPIRKSPREFIIPIAVEGGGYVTPRAGSLEPGETTGSASTLTSRSSKFDRARRMNSLLNDREGSEDESSPFSGLHRHSSFGRDSDTEDPRRDAFHMHRLRSSRPRKSTLEHADSLSSGEDDDDDGFEILTAENLFSTLLSRVRDLTQRLNVDDGGRPGFPSSRLLSHFDHGTNFWNMHNRLDPLARKSPFTSSFNRGERASPAAANVTRQFSTPWRRSVSRDLASDIESVFKDAPAGSVTHTATLPRGDEKMRPTKNLNLSDLDLKKLKLSDEDALALSYLTPGLSKRIQQQLLAQLAPSEARKLSRTLSMRNDPPIRCRAIDENGNPKDPDESRDVRSFLPVKSPYNGRGSTTTELSDGNLSESSYVKPRATRSMSLREPRLDYHRTSSPRIDYSLRSPDSSVSESVSYRNDDSSLSDRVYSSDLSPTRAKSAAFSRYSSESAPLSKYLSPVKYFETPRVYTPLESDRSKSELKRPSPKRISRFLRPDFYDAPKEENICVKEKKEREMETQKVLKEIRDKRIKNRLNLRRERSASRNRTETPDIEANHMPVESETDVLLKNVSENIKVLESTVKTVPDYVNVPSVSEIKKERISKLVRPKSYPTESPQREIIVPETESSKLKSRLKKGFMKPKSTDKTSEVTKTETGNGKNKLLQTLEKKIGRLRSTNNTPTNDEPEENGAERKSNVESVIKRLREQSLPRNLDHITESGLIKRAVSVEDMHVGDSKPLQASRKSVTKILGLFKKYEDKKKEDKAVSKNKKVKDTAGKNSKTNSSASELSDNKKVNSSNKSVKKKLQKDTSMEQQPQPQQEEAKNNCDAVNTTGNKPERPRSLLFDQMQRFQPVNDFTKSETAPTTVEIKPKTSKLPVNAFRRSLNLENTPKETPNVPKSRSKTELTDQNTQQNHPDRQKLRLDLNVEPKIVIEPVPETNANNNNRNSLTTTDESSVLMSPYDDASCDSWSAGSDCHTHELASPVSPSNGYLYSGDESESVSDRIRRKSFYSRFNEKKRPRRTSGSFRDLDLYKDLQRCGFRAPREYDPLERRSVDYRYKSSSDHDGSDREFDYPKSSGYRTYNPRTRYSSSLYADPVDASAVDDGKLKKYGSYTRPSTYTRKSVSPLLNSEHCNNNAAPGPSLIPNNFTLSNSRSSN